MKKLLLLLAFAVVAMAASAQVGSVKSVTFADLEDATADTSSVVSVTSSYNAITFQALCTESDGSTSSSGTIILQGSVDGISYLTLSEDVGWAIPNDTLTISEGAIWQFSVTDAALKYYRAIGVTSASDTVTVTLKYLLK